jgi:hypothetical protein
MNSIKRCFVLFFLVCSLPCAAQGVAGFSGNWSGMMSEGGEPYQLNVTFSADGFPVVSYTNNKDLTRQVELRSPGQKVQYVPDGGGIKTMILEDIARDATSLAYAMRTSFKRASNGYSSESYHRYVVEYVLQGTDLHLTIVDQGSASMGDSEMKVGGSPRQSVARGVLKRVR